LMGRLPYRRQCRARRPARLVSCPASPVSGQQLYLITPIPADRPKVRKANEVASAASRRRIKCRRRTSTMAPPARVSARIRPTARSHDHTACNHAVHLSAL
jgi:hypothetical protein